MPLLSIAIIGLTISAISTNSKLFALCFLNDAESTKNQCHIDKMNYEEKNRKETN